MPMDAGILYVQQHSSGQQLKKLHYSFIPDMTDGNTVQFPRNSYSVKFFTTLGSYSVTRPYQITQPLIL